MSSSLVEFKVGQVEKHSQPSLNLTMDQRRSWGRSHCVHCKDAEPRNLTPSKLSQGYRQREEWSLLWMEGASHDTPTL